MPIPKPKTGEDRSAFITRCMESEVMNKEFPDSKQRAAVCHTSWRDNMARDINKVELFAVGRWNGMEFTIEDLNQIAAAFHTLGESHRVPLKFGHNGEQPLTDGQPAIGWVEDVWVEDGKLIGKFANVPDVVFNAIDAKLYDNVSIELDMGVEWKGQHFTWVLSGVALLGADIPAVNTLSDLSAFMSRDEELKVTKNFSFSRSVKRKEDKQMAKTVEELQAELDAERRQNADLSKKNEGLVSDKAKFSKENEDLRKEAEQREEADRKAKFARAKEDITKTLDDLVKSNHITPAQREGVLSEYKEDQGVIDRMQFAVKTLKDGAPSQKLPGKGGTTTMNDGDKEGMAADEIVVERTKEYMAKNNCSFAVANRRVLETDPELARQYVDMNGTKEA